MHLSTLLIVTNTYGALTKAVGPVATNVGADLRDALVRDEEPCAKDNLGHDIEDSVGNDLGVNRDLASTIGDTPDTGKESVKTRTEVQQINVHGVGSPEDQGESSNRSKERGDLATLSHSLSTAVKSQVPDDDEVGEAGNGVVSPLGWVVLGAESSEKTGQDHDDVSNDGQKGVSTVETSEEAEIEEEKRGGDGPVDVTSPVNLAIDVLGGVRDVLVLLSDDGVVV